VGIYIYYGNPDAEDLSNGEAVFDFFDDFSSSSNGGAEDDEAILDPEKWEIYPGLGSSELLNSRLKLDAAKIISKTYQIKDGIIEYRATTNNEARAIIRAKKQAPELTQLVYSSVYKEIEHSIVVDDIVKINTSQPILPNTPYDYRVIAKGENITFERYGIAISLAQASVSYKDAGGLKRGSIGLETGSDSISYYDWLRVRKLAECEPEITFSGKEEPTNLAQFLGTTLTEDGNLIVKKFVPKKGNSNEALRQVHNLSNRSERLVASKVESSQGAIYVSKIISTPFQTRIMIPKWAEDKRGISIDISADGGKTYRTKCKNGSYYYVSKEDFTAGDELKYRAVITNPKGAKQSPQLEEVSIDYCPGNIILISPDERDTWQAGTRQKILWLASGYESAYPIRIEYSLDAGKTYNMIKRREKNTGACFWKIPRRLSDKKVLIKVSDALDENIYDISDGTLEIK